MDSSWERFDEGFDVYEGGGNGGALYVKDNGDDTFDVAGVLWLDALGDEKPYSALISRFALGEGFDPIITDKYSAAANFQFTCDAQVVEDFGEYDTIQDAIAIVEDHINMF